MIWIGLLILATLICIAFLIDWHLGTIRGQLEGLGQAIIALAEGVRETNEHLQSVVDHTNRLPKPRKRRASEYPGDPLAADFEDN